MKNYLMAFASILFIALSAGCSKDGGGAGSGGNRITNSDEAITVLNQIDNLWNNVLRAQLTKKDQSLSDSVLTDGSGGKATVSGSYDITSSSSSSSSLHATEANFYITFDNYTVNGLSLNGGPLRFYDYSYTRTACSSSGCASSSKAETAYQSMDEQNKVAPPVTISFTSNDGRKYKDNIIFSASKEYAHWNGKLINSKNDTINFTY